MRWCAWTTTSPQHEPATWLWYRHGHWTVLIRCLLWVTKEFEPWDSFEGKLREDFGLTFVTNLIRPKFCEAQALLTWWAIHGSSSFAMTWQSPSTVNAFLPEMPTVGIKDDILVISMFPRIWSTTWHVLRPQCTINGIQLKRQRPRGGTGRALHSTKTLCPSTTNRQRHINLLKKHVDDTFIEIPRCFMIQLCRLHLLRAFQFSGCQLLIHRMSGVPSRKAWGFLRSSRLRDFKLWNESRDVHSFLQHHRKYRI